MASITVIAVMGTTGSGKSNFIRLATGLSGTAAPQVGHDLISCTQETKSFECVIEDRRFIFIDTPGFGDTYRGDGSILRSICDSLGASYSQDLRVNGIIYLHRIKDQKMTFTQMRNLEMMRDLCGIQAYSNVVLVTTFWDELPDIAKGIEREAQLLRRNDMWGAMCDQGSKSMRFKNTRDSALAIVFEVADFEAIKLQVQTEMVDQGRKVGETTAGVALERELNEVKQRAKDELEKTVADKEAAHQERMRKVYERHAQELEEQLRVIEHEQALIQEENREDNRRLEQMFADQVLRLNRERDNMIKELDLRLARDKEAKANEVTKLHQLIHEQQARLERKEEEEQLEKGRENQALKEKLKKARRELENAQQVADNWNHLQADIDARLREAEINNIDATGPKKIRTKMRVKEIREEKSRSFSITWDRVVAGIASAAGVLALAVAIVGLPFGI